MNKLLHRSCYAIAGGLLSCIVSGCATGPNGLASGGLFSESSLRNRQTSAAQTPLAQSQAMASEKRRMQESLSGAPKANSYPTANGNNDAGLAGITLASYAQEPAPAPKRAAVPESVLVPREPIPSMPQIVDPTAPVSGSPYQLTGHIRRGGGAQGHGSGDCPSCETGLRYRPVFPQMRGNCVGGCEPTSNAACGPACGPECEPLQRCMDPQEYIFDGGDRDPEVRLRDDMTQSGLDPEDTVIQFTTADGKTHVQSGCRVAIYAPRFASVRKRTSSLVADLALRPQTSVLPDGPGIVREQLPPVNIMQPVSPVNKDTVRVVEAFRERQRPLPAELVLPMGVLSDAFSPYEDLDIIRYGNLLATDPAKLAIAAAAARQWTNVDQLKVIIDGQEASLISDVQQQQEVALYEFKGARIRLCKVASEQMANPGDIISFTIRFDNVGEQPLKNLVVTDSLAPRLEYVDASQKASLAATFSTIPNEAGSKVLRWEFENPIKPGEGGFVRFDTKVR